jgi:hypothetical protein
VSVTFDGEQPPQSWMTGSGEAQPPRAAVLEGAIAEVRLAQLKSGEHTRDIPVMVIDVARPEDIPALIRAGASDACLADVSLETVSQKILRLIKRRR